MHCCHGEHSRTMAAPFGYAQGDSNEHFRLVYEFTNKQIIPFPNI